MADQPRVGSDGTALDVIAESYHAYQYDDNGTHDTLMEASHVADAVLCGLKNAGYRIVHPAQMHDDCPDSWTCCIHNLKGEYPL